MFNFISNIKVRNKVFFAILLPLLAYLSLAIPKVINEVEVAAEFNRTDEMSLVAVRLGNVIHEMQKERGLSAGFISSGGKSFINELPSQRQATDKQIKILIDDWETHELNHFGEALGKDMSAAISMLEGLAVNRQSVSNQSYNVPAMAKYYTGAINKFLHAIADMPRFSSNSILAQKLVSYFDFLEGKEKAGIERAMGAAGFATGQFKPEVYQNFVSMIAKQAAFFTVFREQSDPSLTKLLDDVESSKEATLLEKLRAVALDSPFSGTMLDIEASSWFAASTARIELLKSVEDAIGEDVVKYAHHLVEEANTLLITDVLIIVIVLLITILIAWVLVRDITGPLYALSDDMRELSGGNLAVDVHGQDRGDELGGMAKALQVFKKSAEEVKRLEEQAELDRQKAEAEKKRAIRELSEEISGLSNAAGAGDLTVRLSTANKEDDIRMMSESLNNMVKMVGNGLGETAKMLTALSEGDLTRRMQGDFQGAFAELMSNSNTTAERLTDIVVTITEASSAVQVATSEIATGSADLAARTEQQASNLEETAAAMEELTATVRQNADSARQASTLSTTARESADKGGTIVSEAIDAMNKISGSSKKITEIVKMIEEIAFQTNLLALNAAVEAARAGEAGKGFAVVASEVRALAQRSSEASKEISSLIQMSAEQVDDGVKLVDKTGVTLEEIVTSVNRVADIVAEISSASQEQATGLDEVNSAVSNMDQMTQQNAALVEETTAAAQSLETQANELTRQIGFFKTDGNARPAPAAAATSKQDASAPKPAPADKPAAKPASAPAAGDVELTDDDWQEF